MGYKSAMEAAGAEVIEYAEFGCWQGEWIAKVSYGGENGYVMGGFGSCSSCDAFEAEFSDSYDDEPDYNSRLAEFGKSYLDDIRSFEDVMREALRNLEWDSDAQVMVDWLNSVAD